MRGFQVTELCHPSNITLSLDVPEPKAGDDKVIVDVYSAGANFFDILQAQGKYQHKPPLPFVMGAEFAGRISRDSPIPKGCPYKPGQRVFGASQGSFADRVAVRWGSILPLSDRLSFDQGAGLYVTWPTSYEALVGRAELKPAEWVLVTAAAGGVGIAAVQLAKALGANVIAAAGSEVKLEVAKRLGGADFVVNYTKPGWQKEVLKMTNGRGVDVIYDPVGLINDCLKCIAWKGRAIVVGFAAGQIEKVPMNIVLLKNVSIVGIHWGAYQTHEPGHIPSVWRALLELFSTGRARPVTYDRTYSLESVRDGLAALEARETWGKVVIKVRDESDGVKKAKL